MLGRPSHGRFGSQLGANLGEHRVQHQCRVFLKRRQHMAVRVQRNLDRVSQSLRDDFRVDVGQEQDSRRGMTKVMESNQRNVGFRHQGLKRALGHIGAARVSFYQCEQGFPAQ